MAKKPKKSKKTNKIEPKKALKSVKSKGKTVKSGGKTKGKKVVSVSKPIKKISKKAIKVSKVSPKQSKEVLSAKSLTYADNVLNRKLGRVGKKYKSGVKGKYTSSKLKSKPPKGLASKKSKKLKKALKGAHKTKGRYQVVISAISKWNKEQFETTGMKLTREQMYERYRMIRDTFPTVDTNDLVGNISYYLQGKEERTLEQFKKTKPDIATDPIEWWSFDEELMSSSDWFYPDDVIRLRLETEDGDAKFHSLGFKSFTFEYKDLITAYSNLYATGFTSEMRKYCSPPPVFVFSESESDVESGFYTFFLDCEDESVINKTKTTPSPITPQQPSVKTPQVVVVSTIQDEIVSLNKQIENYQDEKKDLRDLLKQKIITKKEYNSDKKTIESTVSNLRLQLDILKDE